MEIDEQSEWNIEQFHVAQQLRLMDRKNLFNGFYFDKQAIVNQQIKAEGSSRRNCLYRMTTLSWFFTSSATRVPSLGTIHRSIQAIQVLCLVDFNRCTDDVVSNSRGLQEQGMHD